MSTDKNTRYSTLTVSFEVARSDEELAARGYPSTQELLASAHGIAEFGFGGEITEDDNSLTTVMNTTAESIEEAIDYYSSDEAITYLQRDVIGSRVPVNVTTTINPHNNQSKMAIRFG